MDMKQKQKPSIMITTYNCTIQNENNRNHSYLSNGGAHLIESTNLFSMNHNQLASANLRFSIGDSRHHPSLALFAQLKGPSGSVRGHKDVVKKSLENIKSVASSSRRNFTSSNLPTFMPTSQTNNPAIQHMDEIRQIEYLNDLIRAEHNLCVIYTTTLGVIRRTFEDSKLMRSILNLNLIKYEERDVYLNQEYKHQLRMRCKSIRVPTLFIEGKFLGGIHEVESMNENGKLAQLLAKFKMTKAPKDMCLCCGNAKFIACQQCNGSRKSTIRHFKFNSIALRCIKCDKNDGLVLCPACCGRSKLSSSNLASIDEKSIDANNNQTN